MPTSPEYDAILARKLAEREAKMGHTHKQMTESETAQEIAQIMEGAKSVFAEGATISGSSELPGGLVIHVKPQAIEGYTTKSGRVMKSKPGRKVGSKNKPKEPK